jgi:hypothetical protein
MQNSITVREAIKRGKRIIIYPSRLMIFLSILSSVYLAVVYDNLNILYVGIGLGAILPFAYKFVIITRWKIWAFENVRNVHQLRQKAYEEGLIFSQDNSNFFEFRSAHQQNELEKLDQKFLQEDVFQDDVLIPEEMIIHFSILKAVFSIIIWGSALCFGIYIYNRNAKAIVIIGLTAYILFLKSKNLVNREPQILINNSGIQLENEKLISWREIKDERLVVEKNYGRAKIRKKYLSFSTENSSYNILINSLDISFGNLENALQVYRFRYENKKLE